MNGRTSLARYVNPKSILFGVTVFNFVILWYTANTMPGACVACPWFYPWSYFNEPTLLLVGALFLCFGRKWSYLVTVGVSGYLIGDLIYRFWAYNLSVVDNVRQFFSPYQETVYAWQIQYLLALVVFIEASSYIAGALISERPIQQALAADSP